jgi:two-component system, NarL family, nitrate/nitrite response regulator NarL
MSLIFIADAHNLYREALCNYLKNADQGLSIEGFADIDQLAARLEKTHADLVIMDDDLSGRDILAGSKTAIIVREVQENIDLGSSLNGVFSRKISCKNFHAGIRDILSGGTFFSRDNDTAEIPVIGTITKPQDFSLTLREKEVLSYLVKGQSNKDIARALDLQVVTIKLHVRGICRKMKAENRTQAALTAKENGWS